MTSKLNIENQNDNEKTTKKKSFLRSYIEEKIEKKYSNKKKLYIIGFALILYLFFLIYNFFFLKKENLKLGTFKGISKEENFQKKRV
jgi:hypothetical protein